MGAGWLQTVANWSVTSKSDLEGYMDIDIPQPASSVVAATGDSVSVEVPPTRVVVVSNCC